MIDGNREHLAQVSGTPFTMREMIEKLFFTADSEIAEKAVEGEDIEGPTSEATEILMECRRKIPEDITQISKEEIKMGLKNGMNKQAHHHRIDTWEFTGALQTQKDKKRRKTN